MNEEIKKEINELIDYIDKNTLNLVPNLRMSIINKKNTLLSDYQNDISMLKSEHYIKYHLTLITYDGALKKLYDGLTSLKLELDTYLKDGNSFLEYGEKYIKMLGAVIAQNKSGPGNLFENIAKLKKIFGVLNNVGNEIVKISPYYLNEIYFLGLKAIQTSVDRFYLRNDIPEKLAESNLYLNDNISDKIITYFNNLMSQLESSLDNETINKYYNIEMLKESYNKTYYIICLASLINFNKLNLEPETKKM